MGRKARDGYLSERGAVDRCVIGLERGRALAFEWREARNEHLSG